MQDLNLAWSNNALVCGLKQYLRGVASRIYVCRVTYVNTYIYILVDIAFNVFDRLRLWVVTGLRLLFILL